MDRNAAIGIFDSGFGGLTVMRAIRGALPYENIVYFGDTARLPYGNKSPEALLRYSIENASFLVEQGIKLLVIACHTACAHALGQVRQQLSIPVIGIIETGVEEAVRLSRHGKIAVIGTRATINSNVYQREILSRLPTAEITAISCPLFVPIVEEGYHEHALADLTIHEYLAPLLTKPLDTLLLGCTHYSFLEPAIRRLLSIQIVDPATACAATVAAELSTLSLLNPQIQLPHYHFFVSDDPEKFRLLGKTFLNYPIEHISIP